MKVIYKYKIPLWFEFKLDLPVGSDILSVQLQDDIPVMWVLHDNDNPLETRFFRLILTGLEIDNELNLRYIDTFQLQRFGKGFVYHMFEEIINE